MIAIHRNWALGREVYQPTPTEIRRACEKIQATWSPRVRAKRNTGPRVAWLDPANHPAVRPRRGNQRRTGRQCDVLRRGGERGVTRNGCRRRKTPRY